MRNLSYENEFTHKSIRMQIIPFSYERFRTWTRFETESEGNSEMAYLRLAGSKEFGLLLKLIFYNSIEVITGFPRHLNQRNRFRTQFHAIVSLVEKTFQTANKQGRAERTLLHVKLSSAATYAVRRRRTRPRAIPLALNKISGIDGLPYFLTQDAPGAPLKCFFFPFA